MVEANIDPVGNLGSNPHRELEHVPPNLGWESCLCRTDSVRFFAGREYNCSYGSTYSCRAEYGYTLASSPSTSLGAVCAPQRLATALRSRPMKPSTRNPPVSG